jgi:organic hydroperoxide reductase OsmC/OhrA
MRITATVRNQPGQHAVALRTGEQPAQTLTVPAHASGQGSAVNGGQFLMLALATCYCNDLYREAKRLGIPIDAVEVEAEAEFAGIGLAATDIRYRAAVRSPASDAEIQRLLVETDAVAEVHNTLRGGAAVTFLVARE